MRMVSLLFTLLVLAGCATAPADDGERPIANGVEVARSVVLCQTKVAELEARLGSPSRDGVLARSRVLTWIVDWDPLVKYLGVLADEDGTVVDVYWNLPSEVPWSPVNRCSLAIHSSRYRFAGRINPGDGPGGDDRCAC